MSSAPDPQLQRALTALRALEPPSNGFEVRLRGSLLQAAADPALWPERAPLRSRPAPARLWRRRPLAALSLAALSLAGAAAAFRTQSWLPWRAHEVASAPSAEPAPPRVAAPPVVPPILQLPPVSEPLPALPAPLAPLQQTRGRPPVRAHRDPPARGASANPAWVTGPAPAAAPAVVPRFDLPDVPAHESERGSVQRGEHAGRRELPGAAPEDRSLTLDRVSEARERAAERRRALDRPRPSLEPTALDRDRRAPEVREREHEEREQPEPRESEGHDRR